MGAEGHRQVIKSSLRPFPEFLNSSFFVVLATTFVKVRGEIVLDFYMLREERLVIYTNMHDQLTIIRSHLASCPASSGHRIC